MQRCPDRRYMELKVKKVRYAIVYLTNKGISIYPPLNRRLGEKSMTRKNMDSHLSYVEHRIQLKPTQSRPYYGSRLLQFIPPLTICVPVSYNMYLQQVIENAHQRLMSCARKIIVPGLHVKPVTNSDSM